MGIMYNDSFFRKQIQREMVNKNINLVKAKPILIDLLPIGFYKTLKKDRILIYIFRRFISRSMILKIFTEFVFTYVVVIQEDVKKVVEYLPRFKKLQSGTLNELGIHFTEYYKGECA